jgi:DNA-binding transcriptional LysR family regulator
MNVDLRQLRAFIAVARSLNFTRAAEDLHIAQPSLSHTIQQLERNVGFPLLKRTTRTTELTREGATFLREAEAVLDRYDLAMARTARVARGEVGQLRVGYLIGAAVDHVPAILRSFNETYPEVELELIEYNFAAPNAGLDTGETDVAIVRPPLGAMSGVIQTTLLHEQCFVCVSSQHRFAGLESIDVADVLDEPIIAAPGSGVWRDMWILNDIRTEPARVTYEAATFEAELRAVAVSQSISIMPAIAPALYARPGVAFVPLRGRPDCDVAVVRRRDAPLTAINFAALARRVVRAATGTVIGD